MAVLVTATTLLLTALAGFPAWAQTTKPTITVTALPQTAQKGAEVKVQISVSNFTQQAGTPAGLTAMQATFSWVPADALVPATQNFCNIHAPFTSTIGISCQPNAITGQALFVVSNPNPGTPFTQGIVIEFTFTVSNNADNGKKVDLKLGGAIGNQPPQVFSGGVQPLAASQFTVQNGTFTVGAACTITVNFDYSPKDSSGRVERNASITFNDTSFASPSNCLDASRSRTWNFGDNTQEVTTTSASTTHPFSTAGTFTVRLRFNDTSGTERSKEQAITVIEPPCKPTNVSITFSPVKPVINKRVSFSGNATACAAETIAQFSWSFGDSQSGTGQKVDHTFTSARTFTVTLTVKASGGGTEAATKSVKVIDRPSCESLSCARSELGKLRHRIIDFAQGSDFPFDDLLDMTNQAMNLLDKNLIDRLAKLAEAMSKDGKDRFDGVVEDLGGAAEAARDGVKSAIDTGDISGSRARSIEELIDRFQSYLEDRLPGITDELDGALSELPTQYEDAANALDDNNRSEALDALIKARSLLLTARRDVDSIMNTALLNLSQISRAVLVAERLARRRIGGGTLPPVMQLGAIALTRGSENSRVFRALGADSIRIELRTLNGRIAFVQEARGPELVLTTPSSPVLANGVYLAYVIATAKGGASTVRLFKLVLMH